MHGLRFARRPEPGVGEAKQAPTWRSLSWLKGNRIRFSITLAVSLSACFMLCYYWQLAFRSKRLSCSTPGKESRARKLASCSGQLRRGHQQQMSTTGYVSEIEYVHNYNVPMSPMHMVLATKIAGRKARISQEPNYLELGFGQGLSLNIHAAANPGTYWGNDFNATQTANALDLAAASGADLRITDESFSDLAGRTDLPMFDMIALHGIWSWVSEENRRIIVDIARRKLKIGGLLYVSYNCYPGWAATTPIRHLLSEHASNVASGTILNRLQSSLDFVQSLIDANAQYFKSNPEVVQRWEQLIKQHDKRYVAHEYLNENWDIMYFTDVANRMADAKLSFAASAHLLDLVDPIHLTPRGLEIVNGIDSDVLKQTTRDVLVNQQFRRDVFIKGEGKLHPVEQQAALTSQLFVMILPSEKFPKTVHGTLGEGKLNPAIYDPIAEFLSSDNFRPKTIAQMMKSPLFQKLTLPQVAQAMTILSSVGAIAPCHEDAVFNSQRSKCSALNSELCRQAETSANVGHLASPLTGTGLTVSRFDQLFLRAEQIKEKDPVTWIWSLLKRSNEKFLSDGKPLETEKENKEKLQSLHKDYLSEKRSILFRMGVM